MMMDVSAAEKFVIERFRATGPYADFTVLKRPIKGKQEGELIKVIAAKIDNIPTASGVMHKIPEE